MIDADKSRMRTMTESDLDCVLAWRNHPSIRKCMISQHVITAEEHRRWFSRSSGDEDRQLLIFEESNSKLGFVHFSGVTSETTLNWGFYKAPEAPAGTGKKLGLAALYHGFEVLGAHKVCGQALGINNSSIQFHKSLGFRQEGVLREQHRIGDHYYDLFCFGLLKHEWLKRRQSEKSI